jgi:hypothetical protein
LEERIRRGAAARQTDSQQRLSVHASQFPRAILQIFLLNRRFSKRFEISHRFISIATVVFEPSRAASNFVLRSRWFFREWICIP